MSREDVRGKVIDLRKLDASSLKQLDRYQFLGRVLFDEVVFGEGVSFENCTFHGEASFRGATLGKGFRFRANSFESNLVLEGSEIGESFEIHDGHIRGAPNFRGVAFPVGTIIDNVNFPEGANFEGATLNHGIKFGRCTFSDSVTFKNIEFGADVEFIRCTFASGISFEGARFEGGVDFSETRLRNTFDFRVLYVTGETVFRNAIIECRCDFTGTQFRGDADFSSSRPESESFWEIVFEGATFGADAKFNGRTFKDSTNFAKVSFAKPPQFFHATLHPDTSFVRNTFGGLDGENAERCFRTLKLEMNEHQAHHEELMFFGLEMEARRLKKSTRFGARALMCAYKRFSGYGQSVAKPVRWLLYTLIASFLAYGAYDSFEAVSACRYWIACWPPFDLKRIEDLATFTLAQSVPFVSLSKAASEGTAAYLFKGDYRIVLLCIAALQGIATVVFAFLIGLGLRNLFRLK